MSKPDHNAGWSAANRALELDVLEGCASAVADAIARVGLDAVELRDFLFEALACFDEQTYGLTAPQVPAERADDYAALYALEAHVQEAVWALEEHHGPSTVGTNLETFRDFVHERLIAARRGQIS